MNEIFIPELCLSHYISVFGKLLLSPSSSPKFSSPSSSFLCPSEFFPRLEHPLELELGPDDFNPPLFSKICVSTPSKYNLQILYSFFDLIKLTAENWKQKKNIFTVQVCCRHKTNTDNIEFASLLWSLDNVIMELWFISAVQVVVIDGVYVRLALDFINFVCIFSPSLLNINMWLKKGIEQNESPTYIFSLVQWQ